MHQNSLISIEQRCALPDDEISSLFLVVAMGVFIDDDDIDDVVLHHMLNDELDANE